MKLRFKTIIMEEGFDFLYLVYGINPIVVELSDSRNADLLMTLENTFFDSMEFYVCTDLITEGPGFDITITPLYTESSTVEIEIPGVESTINQIKSSDTESTTLEIEIPETSGGMSVSPLNATFPTTGIHQETNSFTLAETSYYLPTSRTLKGQTFTSMVTLDLMPTGIKIEKILNHSMSLGSDMNEEEAVQILISTMEITSNEANKLEENDVSNVISTLGLVAPSSASSEKTVKMFLSVVDNILEEDLLASTTEPYVESTILSLMESYTAAVSENAVSENLASKASSNVKLTYEKIVVQMQAISSNTTTSMNWINVSFDDGSVQVCVPTANIKGKSVKIGLITTVYKTLHVTIPDKIEGNQEENPTRMGSFTVSLIITENDVVSTRGLLNLNNPLEISLDHVVELRKDEQAICTYWKFKDNQNGGVWSEDGCWVASALPNKTICHCTHLTNFAILMRVNKSPQVLSVQNALALEILTYLLTSLSIICLLLTIFTYVRLKIWRARRNIIHINLAASLAMAQFFYICFINATNNKSSCTFVAILLQYLFTVSFAWMLLEGVHLLMMSNISLQHKNPKTYVYVISGWVSPLVIVLISFLVKPSSYGTENSCWLDTSTDIIWAFVTPILLVIFGNTFVLLSVIKRFMSLKANVRKSRRERMRTSIRAVLMMLPLMGMTWIFGLVASFDKTNFFAYMFVIFNSSQGVFIFSQLIVLNNEVGFYVFNPFLK
ncbi:adhesion G-protein coupled receptor D1-like [Anneissia japonica]|uniref:adhesion G-protein coupled receptor D1-like n=1 Tax=Anneissia japonica TaxID=1529436 RepID=UPI00142584FE|nr:adhesion G-protein coupled receptor D1-like [Anneissia japonica]